MLHQGSGQFVPDMKQTVESNLDQEKRVADSAIDIVRSAIESFSVPSNACNYFVIDHYRRSLDLAQTSTDAWLAFIRRLSQAETPAEWFALQAHFVNASFAEIQRNSMMVIKSCQDCASAIGKPK